MLVACVGFEAKSIQRYILGSGKLRDAVGASAIVDQLTEKPLALLYRHLFGKPVEEDRFSRRAGGAFFLFFEDESQARRFAEAWSLFVPAFAPALEFTLAVGMGSNDAEAAADASRKLQANRFPQPVVPLAPPMTGYYARTGLPSTRWMRTPEGEQEAVDEATARKRQVAATQQVEMLAEKFLPSGERRWRFPLDLEKEMPLVGENRYVGIVHADANGIGAIVHRIHERLRHRPDAYRRSWMQFSKGLAKATRAAAQWATQQVLIPAAEGGVLPARPLVLGGDDLTVIVRADLALAFCRAFLERFEEEANEGLRPFFAEIGMPEQQITASAGIAFVKLHQPFLLAYELAEALCAEAKRQAQRQCSALAFHRVTTSTIPDAQWWLQQDMRAEARGESWQLTMGAYAVGSRKPPAAMARLADLLALLELFSRPADESLRRAREAALRRLLSLAHESPEQARRAYRRWRQLLEETEQGRAFLDEFDARLSVLFQAPVQQELPARQWGEGWQTPLGDMLSLQAVGAIAAGEG